MRWLLKLVTLGLLVACGRVGFDDARDAGGQLISRDAPPEADPLDAAPPDPSLVAHYTMDSLLDNTTLHDDSGYGNRGACVIGHCPGTTTGEVSDALVFDGTSEQITVPAAPSLSSKTALTVAVWFKSQAIGDTFTHCLISRPYGAGSADSWQLCIDSDSALYGGVETTGDAPVGLYSPTMFVPNAWQHVALTWNGASAILYQNGQPVADSAAVSIVYDNSPMVIGGDSDVGAFTAGFAGALDEIYVFDRALSGAEIAMLADD